jgi:hypothetical protein
MLSGRAPYAARIPGRYRLVDLEFRGGADWVREKGEVEIR